MEIQFQKNAISYLQTLLREQQKQEQTQQIRLSDAMPDIEHVIGCWGQVLIRGKEWRGGSLGISGGIIAWVLYQPENEGAPCCVDTWIPFQMKWDVDETERDGVIEVCTSLCHIDARMLSDRKLMVRANVCAQMHAMVGADTMIYEPADLPGDVQVLQHTYPMMLPAEAGEKQFDIEQQLEIPPDGARVHQVVRFTALPTLTEYKIVADKLVLRGSAEIYVLYMDDMGKLNSNTWKLPFSQYTQLDGEYTSEADVSVCFALTQLELERLQPDSLNLKLGLTAQYIVSRMQNITVTEDMYSTQRDLKQSNGALTLPSVLQSKTQEVKVDLVAPDGRVIDVSMHREPVQINKKDDLTEITLEGLYQILYEDAEGKVQNSSERWQKTVTETVSPDTDYHISLWQAELLVPGKMSGVMLQIHENVVAMTPMQMVMGAQLGDAVTRDPKRPSIILRRAGGDTLWDIAKSLGSTVEQIQKINAIQEEPDGEKMLLIPIF